MRLISLNKTTVIDRLIDQIECKTTQNPPISWGNFCRKWWNWAKNGKNSNFFTQIAQIA